MCPAYIIPYMSERASASTLLARAASVTQNWVRGFGFLFFPPANTYKELYIYIVFKYNKIISIVKY